MKRWMVLAGALGLAIVGAFLAFNPPAQRAEPQTDVNVPYQLLVDDMGTTIDIGVSVNVTQAELKSALLRAANDHQDDPSRDYLMSQYLWVRAFLVKDGHTSTAAAGVLRRVVPFKNPRERREMKEDRSRYDKFTFNLEKAKRSLK